VYVFPASAVQRLDASSAAVMAFIISGGVTEISRDVPAPEPGVSKARTA
jgi:hypothetical protein